MVLKQEILNSTVRRVPIATFVLPASQGYVNCRDTTTCRLIIKSYYTAMLTWSIIPYTTL